jgi:hypothetical protein
MSSLTFTALRVCLEIIIRSDSAFGKVGITGSSALNKETFGDPMHCYVEGQMVEDGKNADISGYGGCHQGLPAGTWLKVCIRDRPEFVSSSFPHWALALSASVSCSGGDLFEAYVAFWVPGGRTLYEVEKEQECGAPYTEDMESVSQAVFEEIIKSWLPE